MTKAMIESNYLKDELYGLVSNNPAILDFLQNSSLDGLWYWDIENPENEWMNARFWELLGYDPKEKKHLANEWQSLINPDDLKVAIENFQKHCADPNHPYDQIVRYRHKNGKTIWVRCRGMAIRDEYGKAIRMLGAHNDLTSQKELEESLLQSNAQLTELNSRLEAEIAQKNHYVKILNESETSFRLSFDYAAIGMGLVGPDGRWLRVNKSLCQMLGMTETELLAKTFQEITHPDDLELDLKHVNDLIEGSISNYHMEKRYFHKLGHIIWINLSASLVRDEHNNESPLVL